MRLFVDTDRHLIRAQAQSTRYLHIRFSAPEIPRTTTRRPLSVAIVLDRSGSMSGDKFTLARQAVDRCLGLLAPRDAAALVVFDDEVDVLQQLGAATAEHKRVALGRLGEVGPRGSTDLTSGWYRGAEQAAPAAAAGAMARVLLLTDGLANQGLVAPDAIAHLVQQARAGGVATSTFGVGADFDERLLEAMAEAGGGNFYYLERPEAMLEMLTTELGDALEVVARDAAIILDLPEDVTVESPAAWAVSRDGRRVRVALGDLISGQDMELVLALRFPTGTLGNGISAHVSFTDRDDAVESTESDVAWTFASHADADAEAGHPEVLRAVARVYAARARREAAEFNRNDNLGDARKVLEATARRISGYAGTDTELQQLVVQLTNESREHVRRFEAAELKERHFAAYAVRKDRDIVGRSRRKR